MREGTSVKYYKKKRLFYADSLTEEQKKLIKEMFFGPYKSEWKDKSGIVDNRDAVIAKRINVSKNMVCAYITEISMEHYKEVVKLREKLTVKDEKQWE